MGIDTIISALVVMGLAWVLLNIVCSIALFVLTIVAQFFRDPDGGRRSRPWIRKKRLVFPFCASRLVGIYGMSSV